ncbi:hypothetical protein PISMIDRAFT_676130, partial [Pisolithus microcarpus 441]
MKRSLKSCPRRSFRTVTEPSNGKVCGVDIVRLLANGMGRRKKVMESRRTKGRKNRLGFRRGRLRQ